MSHLPSGISINVNFISEEPIRLSIVSYQPTLLVQSKTGNKIIWEYITPSAGAYPLQINKIDADTTYSIRIYASWKPYSNYGLFIIIIGLVGSSILFLYDSVQYQARLKREALEKEQILRREVFEREQRTKGLKKFIDRYGQKRWGTPKQVKEWKILDIDLRNNFARLSPYEFEELIAKLFEKMNYRVKLTSKTADYGADIIARKREDTFVIQVKKYAEGNKIGAVEVQQLLGSMWKYKANKAIFVTTSTYTRSAIRQTEGAPIELWDGKKLYKLFIEKYLNI